MQKIISIVNGVAKKPEWRMASPVNFDINAHENIAVFGPNGGGKSMFIDMLIGRHPMFDGCACYDFSPNPEPGSVAANVKYITFRDTYGGDNDKTYYLQQRWNQTEISDETPTVKSVLDEAYALSGNDTENHRRLRDYIYSFFDIPSIADKHITLLSSGELRKLKITSSVFSSPRLLIIDNPFIGLDAETREQFKGLLDTMSRNLGIQTMLVLNRYEDVPDFITHVVEVMDMLVGEKVTLDAFRRGHTPTPQTCLSDDLRRQIAALPYHNDDYDTKHVVDMSHVFIKYGERTILKDLNWQIANGDRWALCGQNGAGKSTVLSLICADNPQSYACDITLFDKKRGSGESIWEIKKHIGYVSPEMHRAYHRDIEVMKIVASGFNDSVGLYTHITPEQREACLFWLNVFGIGDKAESHFLKLSSGEQRLVLLARAFVKDPELIVLDEPLHGLDDMNKRLVMDVINAFTSRKNKTLIMVTHYKSEYPECIHDTKTLIKNA